MLTRREFCTAASTALAASCLTPRLIASGWRRAAEPYETKQLRGTAHVVIGDGGNVMMLHDDGAGVLMVDAKYAHTTPRLAATATALFKAQPQALLSTHHHADHTGGNWNWNDASVRVAHKNLVPRLKANVDGHIQRARGWFNEIRRSNADAATIAEAQALFEKITALGADDYAPSVTFENDHTHGHGDVKVACHHYGAGHTDNDAVIHVESINVVHMGDLLFHNLHPYMDVGAGATSRGWQNSLKNAYDLCDADTIVIPGHGELTDREGIMGMSHYFDQVRDFVAAQKRAGKSRDEIAAMKPAVFEGRGFERMMANNLGVLYDELENE